jgi:hypothetical protein
MKKKEVELFIKIQSQMEELYNEISILSKKSQNDALNDFKLSFVNSLLEESNGLLNEKYQPFKDFKCFENGKMPTNSDVVMVLSQYLTCLENMRVDNIEYHIINGWFWVIDNEMSDIKTSEPRKKI